jgi:hypothetical protein
MYETLNDGYGTIYVVYWLAGHDDPVCTWIVPGTISPEDE